MALETPKFMPAAASDRTSDADVLEHREVPGISFHKDGDGIIYYYDEPLVYVAWYQGQMVVATLTDEAHEGPREQAKGWNQTFLVAVEPEFLMKVYNSEVPFRDLYEQPGAKTWFVHGDWQRTGEETWAHQVKVYDDVPFPEELKPDEGVYLDPNKNASSPAP